MAPLELPGDARPHGSTATITSARATRAVNFFDAGTGCQRPCLVRTNLSTAHHKGCVLLIAPHWPVLTTHPYRNITKFKPRYGVLSVAR